MKIFSLICSFLTTILIFLASDAVLKFGAFGGIILCLSFFFASILIFLFKDNLFKKGNEEIKKKGIHIIVFLYFLEIVALHSWVINSVVLYITPSKFFLIVTNTLIVLLLVLFLIKSVPDILKSSLVLLNLFLLFALSIILPNFIYLQKGLETVYHNLLHYHPKVLHSSREGLWMFFFVMTIVFLVKIYVVFVIHEIEHKKIKSYLFLVSLCVGSIMLAFSTMIIVAVTEKVQAIHPSMLIISMLDKLMDSYTFTFLWITLIVGSLISLLTSLAFLKKKIIANYSINNTIFFISIVGVIIVQYLFLGEVFVIDILIFWTIILIPFVIYQSAITGLKVKKR